MVEVLRETTVPIARIRDVLPSAPSKQAVHKWLRKGVRGVDGRTYRLEGCRVGRVWMTSREAVDRFVSRISALPG